MTEETKTEEAKTEIEKIEKPKKDGFNFPKRLKGNNTREYVENVSFVIIFISGIMVALGILLGSIVSAAILIASFGSFFVMVGIVTYIASQFIGVNNG
jgi:F0F1-type ATP synthase assembly protein I